MAEYISEELIRETILNRVSREYPADYEDVLSAALEIKQKVEEAELVDYKDIDDLFKGQRVWWLTDRAIELVDHRRRQLVQRREQMIAQEMGMNGTIPQPTQHQQQQQQLIQQPQTVVPIWYLFAGIAGSIVLGYALSLLRSQGSEEDDNGRDE